MGEGDEAHPLSLPDYWLARYPVTNAQYAHFIEAGGYREKRWWTDTGWAWRRENQIQQPRYWNDKKWNASSLPIVGISWYEAVAFCQFACSVTNKEIRLPTEAEWEKGARGSQGFVYPWGNEWRPEYCNYSQRIGGTTPVGQCSPKGDSPYGCVDMSGNVLEWCLSKYDAYPFRNDDGRHELKGENQRVLRGGSWLGHRRLSAHAAARYRLHPTYRLNDIGFRAVSSKSLSLIQHE
jgi:formylglycine-generating enzyme required for sulfatase activity